MQPILLHVPVEFMKKLLAGQTDALRDQKDVVRWKISPNELGKQAFFPTEKIAIFWNISILEEPVFRLKCWPIPINYPFCVFAL